MADQMISEKLQKTFKPIRTPAFINGQYAGYFDLEELKLIESEALIATRKKMQKPESKAETADVYVYASYKYADDGKLETANFYSGYPKTNSEYAKLSEMSNLNVRALFSR